MRPEGGGVGQVADRKQNKLTRKKRPVLVKEFHVPASMKEVRRLFPGSSTHTCCFYKPRFEPNNQRGGKDASCNIRCVRLALIAANECVAIQWKDEERLFALRSCLHTNLRNYVQAQEERNTGGTLQPF